LTPFFFLAANYRLQISLHSILSFSNEMYGRITSLENLKNHFSGGGNNLPYNTPVGEEYYISPNQTSPPERKANAAIVILGISSIFRF